MRNIMDHFKLHSKYKPTGDQPHAIEELVKGGKPVSDAARSDWFRQDFYNGKCDSGIEQADTDHIA